MKDVLVVLLFGFPAALVSLLISVIGVWKEKYWLVILGAVLFIPFSYYLSGAPGVYRLPLLLPLFIVGSAAAVRERVKPWAWILLLPAFFTTLYVLAVVLFYRF